MELVKQALHTAFNLNSFAQVAMANAAFKLLAASIQKMNDKDMTSLMNVLNCIKEDKLLESLIDDSSAASYSEKVYRFLDGNKNTAQQEIHLHRENTKREELSELVPVEALREGQDTANNLYRPEA